MKKTGPFSTSRWKMQGTPIEIIGRAVSSQRISKDDSLVKIEVHKETGERKIWDCVCPFFAPIYEGDMVACSCVPQGGVLRMERPPFVQILSDKQSVVECFIRMLRGNRYGTKVGPTLATRLYDSLAEQAPDRDVETYLTNLAQRWVRKPDNSLLELMGNSLSTEQRARLLGNWHRQRSLRRLYLLGFTNRDIESTRMDCDELYRLCLLNPFVIPSLPLEKAAEIMDRFQRPMTGEQITFGQVVRTLWRNSVDRGWSCTPLYMIEREFPFLKEENKMEILKKEYRVRCEFQCLYLENMFKVENGLAERLVRIVSCPACDVGFLTRRKDLSPDQIRALEGALTYPLSVITGGPGTGKTTLIGEIVYNLETRGIPYVITSFTGKAVARLKEVLSSHSPLTLHRMIAGVRKRESERTVLSAFQYLIVDECSMIPSELLEEFFQVFGENFNVILVGDPDQLPPIEWGSVFEQVIESRAIPTFRLTNIHRLYKVEGEEDGILQNIRAIAALPRRKKREPPPTFSFLHTPNFLIDTGDIHKVMDIVRACFHQQRIPPDRITVITPFNRDLDYLNKSFQDLYFPTAPAVIDSRGKKWVVGDRVRMKKNSYDINVMNGEEGRVREVGLDRIVVDFGPSGCHSFPLEKPPQKEEKYRYSSLNKDGEEEDEARTVLLLTHSYAMTVHTSQGSEWDFVIVFFSKPMKDGQEQAEYSSFLSRNLIYTALSRAKRLVVCIGDEEALVKAVQTGTIYRCQNMARRLSLLRGTPWEDPKAPPEEKPESPELFSADPYASEDIWGEEEEYED